MTCFEDVAKLLQFNVILNLIHLGYIWYLPKIIKGTVKGQGSLTYHPYPYPQVPLPITLKGYPYPCYCLTMVVVCGHCGRLWLFLFMGSHCLSLLVVIVGVVVFVVWAVVVGCHVC